jgi:hypothetical protein
MFTLCEERMEVVWKINVYEDGGKIPVFSSFLLGSVRASSGFANQNFSSHIASSVSVS